MKATRPQPCYALVLPDALGAPLLGGATGGGGNRLPRGPEAGHDGAMPGSSRRKQTKPPRGAATSPSRRQRAPSASRRRRSWSGFWRRSAFWRRTLRLGWDLLPALGVLAVFLAGFVLDPAAVARLAWDCVTGAFGLFVRLAVSVVLLSCLGLTIWAFWPDAGQTAPKRRPARSGARRPAPAGQDPGGTSPETAKRRKANPTDVLPVVLPASAPPTAAAPAAPAASAAGPAATAAGPPPVVVAAVTEQSPLPSAAPPRRRTPSRRKHAAGNDAVAPPVRQAMIV